MSKLSLDVLESELGMTYRNAQFKLWKNLLFEFAKQLGLGNCFRCGTPIESVEFFSIDHKEAWAHKDIRLYWSLDNIAFSHMRCNTRAHRNRREAVQGKVQYKDRQWLCSHCGEYKSPEEFGIDLSRKNGLNPRCKVCARTEQASRRKSKRLYGSKIAP